MPQTRGVESESPFLRETPTGAALPENNEAASELTTANGGTFTSSSARLSSQSRYRSLDQRSMCVNMIGY